MLIISLTNEINASIDHKAGLTEAIAVLFTYAPS